MDGLPPELGCLGLLDGVGTLVALGGVDMAPTTTGPGEWLVAGLATVAEDDDVVDDDAGAEAEADDVDEGSALGGRINDEASDEAIVDVSVDVSDSILAGLPPPSAASSFSSMRRRLRSLRSRSLSRASLASSPPPSFGRSAWVLDSLPAAPADAAGVTTGVMVNELGMPSLVSGMISIPGRRSSARLGNGPATLATATVGAELSDMTGVMLTDECTATCCCCCCC